MSKNFSIISVDGGAASGKSSTSRAVATQAKLLHIDTGTHYRAITHACIEMGIDEKDPQKIQLALESFFLGTDIRGNEGHIMINNQRIEDGLLRNERVNSYVSAFAAIPEVREKVKIYQRDQAIVARENGFKGLIMEGRDIGSIIFPNADLKIFLTASTKARAQRRAAEGIQDQIAERDKIDSSRKTAPLIIPDKAIVIDSTDLTLEEVVKKVCNLIDHL